MPTQQRLFRQSIALRLRLAFGVVAATTLFASGAALWAFHSVDSTYSVVSKQSFPAAIASARLEASSLEFSSALASLANAQNLPARDSALSRVQLALSDLPKQIDALALSRTKDAETLTTLVLELSKNVLPTDELVIQQLLLSERKNIILQNTGDAQQRFLQAIDPILLAKNADLLSATRRASIAAGASVHSLIDTEFSELHALQQARAEAFRLAAVVSEQGETGLAKRGMSLLAGMQANLLHADPLAQEAGKNLAASLHRPLLDVRREVARSVATFDAVLVPLISQTTLKMISRSDQITLDSTNAVVVLVAEQVASLSAVQHFRGDVVLLASLIAQAANAQSLIRLEEIKKMFEQATAKAKKTLLEIKHSDELKNLHRELYSLILLAEAEDGVFSVSFKKIKLDNELQQLIIKNQMATQLLVNQAQSTEYALKHELNGEMSTLSQRLTKSTWLLAGLTFFSLLISLGIGSIYIRRRISSRLVNLSSNMQNIADGHLDVEINTSGRDEISVMAQSLLVFRNASVLLRAQSAELVVSRDQAEAALQVKGDFLANMSHEIRTPLTAILGYTHLLFDTPLANRQRDYLAKVQSSANLLLGVINDILDISKIEAGKLELEESPFDLFLLLENLAGVGVIQAEKKKLVLVYSVDVNAPQWLIGDSLRLGQILLNLINNAIKFTESGEVELAVSCCNKGNQEFEFNFSIHDSGIGISPEVLNRLFQPFTQADSSTTRRFGGSGLGLAISQQLAHIMGGGISVDSTLGRGSSFKFSLCLKQSNQAAMLIPQYIGRRVLLAEAHTATRIQLCLYLDKMGVQVKSVCTAVEVVQELERVQQPYDVLIIDAYVLENTNIEAVQKIWDIRAKMATVFLTSVLSHDEIMNRWVPHSPVYSLSKPIIAHSLYATIESSLELNNAAISKMILSPKSEPLLGMRILLAEDTPLLSEMSTALLSSLGAVVDSVDNGREVVDLILQQKKKYDVILMDVQMPEMDGMEATRIIRMKLSPVDLPIIALTAHAMDAERRRCLEVGMNDHLAKPINPQHLLKVLLRWIGSNVSDTNLLFATDHVAEALPELAGLGLDKALERLGSLALLKRMLPRLRDQYADTAPRLLLLLTKGELFEAERLAHSLKGVAGTLEALPVYHLAQKLEDQLHLGHTEVDALLTELNTALAVVVASIDAWLGEKGSDELLVEVPSGGEELTLVRVSELDELLRVRSLRARKCFLELQTSLRKLNKSKALVMAQALDQLDFQAARNALQSFDIKSNFG
ncbi:response regulator [Iodobacter sp. CM08]|uniref:response regulator n=1 Tax=Iodobacter sp. CM08 TaxID=3085902 RepID=UPI002981F2EE|nr:response regulator [Iodobacter sp. CM08]MDW5415198.1 response regulator [Iodobacter sp. CM08]